MSAIPLSDPLTGRLAWSAQVADLERFIRLQNGPKVIDVEPPVARVATVIKQSATAIYAEKILAALADKKGHLAVELRTASGATPGSFSYTLNRLIANREVIKDIDAKPTLYYLNRA